MNETYQQMRKRHEDEVRRAREQHEIRMQHMRERHFSEMMQVANPAEKDNGQDNASTL